MGNLYERIAAELKIASWKESKSAQAIIASQMKVGPSIFNDVHIYLLGFRHI